MTAGEDAAAKGQDRYTPTTTTGWAEKPGPLPAKITICPVEEYWVVFILPFFAVAPMAIDEVYLARFCAYTARSNHLAMA